MIISLTGFMGCGKSSVGRELSRLLCCPFMDLDEVIEEAQGRSIPDIFATDGEAAFRRMEAEALCDIVAQPVDSVGPRLRSAQAPPSRGWQNANYGHQANAPLPPNWHFNAAVLALGGGTVTTPVCAEMVREKTVCIYMRATVETLLSHLSNETEGRPMLNTSLREAERRGNLQNRIQELMTLRSDTYEKTAHIIIDTDGMSIEEVAQEIQRNIEKMC